MSELMFMDRDSRAPSRQHKNERTHIDCMGMHAKRELHGTTGG